MPVHDAIPKRKRLNGQLQLFRKPSTEMAGVFASYGRLKHRTDECLSTTLYPKESGLTVSFNFSENPRQKWRGFLLPMAG
ncbi:hypothetical protein EGY08_18325 [Klebsiella sp. FDAARGOS_511]|nr:hypothetical protein EGY08_18325 [Klebsiella sp. FDAARGOS_511]